MVIIESNESHYQPIGQAMIRKLTSVNTLAIKMHMDSGANRSVTPHRNLLLNITSCKPITIDRVDGDTTTTEYGYLKLSFLLQDWGKQNYLSSCELYYGIHLNDTMILKIGRNIHSTQFYDHLRNKLNILYNIND